MGNVILSITGSLPVLLIFPLGYYYLGFDAAISMVITYIAGMGIATCIFAISESS